MQQLRNKFALGFRPARAGLERPRRVAPRPVATWRPIDLETWTKSASRQVAMSPGCGDRKMRISECPAGRVKVAP